jgi:hypothetical protein
MLRWPEVIERDVSREGPRGRPPAWALGLALGAAACTDDVIEHGFGGPAAETGSAYFRRWSQGPPATPGFFPVAVWLQNPANARAYKAIGVNTFLGLHMGPTDRQLADLRAAQAYGIADQNASGLERMGDRAIVAWKQEGLPDGAQPLPGGGYGPCLEPPVVIASYESLRTKDPTRPVVLQLGQGVAYDRWPGRGTCTGKVEMYTEYVKGGDVLSFHFFPINTDDVMVRGKLALVAKGVDRLRQYSGFRKPVWPQIETTPIDDPTHKPTPAQIKAMVWMSIVHGASGIVYFAHIMKPKFVEAGLLADPPTRAAVAAINQQIHELAPVLNAPAATGAVTVTTSEPAVPVDVLAKRHGGALYLFAVAMGDAPTQATFTLDAGPEAGEAEALGEGRRISVSARGFRDAFPAWGVHVYRVR